MLVGESSLFYSAGVKRRPLPRLAVIAVLLGLAACNPVDTWRDLTGASRNDPDPETTPNTGNLAAGEASDYPNLATVPPPPTRAMTAADRERLTQSLIADRANARHTDEQLRAGFPAVSAAPPPPAATAAADTENQRVAAAAPLAAASKPATDLASPVSTGGEEVAPAKTAAASPSAAIRSARVGSKAPAEPGQGLRKRGEPPESGPMESSLEVPQARATPEPEQIQPAPPPPQLPPTPKVATAARTLPGGLAAGGALAPLAPAEVKDTAGFEAPPPPPELAPAAPTRAAAAEAGKGGQRAPAPAVGKPVAEIRFEADRASLTDSDRRALQTVVPIYQENPGKVRIVGYAGAANNAAGQLDSYRAALDRAQSVAAALTQAGIPSDKIQVEASPEGANSGGGRAEVLLEH